MHRFTLTDAHILLGLSLADNGVEISCGELVAACAEVSDTMPTLPEFAAAFNKFLFISAIHLDGKTIYFANFGRAIINSARGRTNNNLQADALLQSVMKELSGYKLKSICNRELWTSEAYHQAMTALSHHRG